MEKKPRLSLFHLDVGWELPTVTLTAPANTTRRFSFGSLNIRRSSATTLSRSESMVSLAHKALTTFIAEDDVQGLQNYLETRRANVDDRDDNGATALHFAAAKGKVNFVRILLNYNAEVNAEDLDNWTPLLCAAKEGHFDVVVELLDRDANKEHRDMGGWTALMWASYKGHTNIALLLLEKGADVNAHGNYHISSLLWASGRGHAAIVKALIEHGAKANIGDKYGTTALVWASRKGDAEIVDILLKHGANVDTAGMHSWTPLLVATMGNHADVVNLLLEQKPNVNAVDKDGCTALALACREGYTEIASALISSGAYINIQDRSGDTNLIHAVKGGHRSIVDLLLKKYADVDIPGKERKTATYTAVEKGNIAILKMLLSSNPDLEIATKDGDTAMLKAVRCRNAEAVSLLLERKAKVSASDKWGDTALHIAMRARSKGIAEILLRNPQNSQLLYRPNRAGETPYNIDMSHTKTILGQIFGARRLNTNEDNENLLGYDLYSSALADMLSEPSLSMPITVGLFAKWGSGKAFLLDKLRDEMKSFARQWVEASVHFSWILFGILVHISIVIGLIMGIVTWAWAVGILVTLGLILFSYVALIVLWYSSQRYNWDLPYNISVILTKKMNTIKVILQVIFCHPPGAHLSESISAQPIRFYFTDPTRAGSTSAGENCVVQMLGSLYDAIEADYGTLSTRLYRAFRPKILKNANTWKWRKLCCLPIFFIFELCLACILIVIGVVTVSLIESNWSEDEAMIAQISVWVTIVVCGSLVGCTIIANSFSISRMIASLMYSQRRRLQRAISRLETVKSEGFLSALKHEVSIMADMVKCLDAFTQQQTRLVVIVNGLESAEQDKVLLILDSVHSLFSEPNSPFIIILAIDPHIIAKAVEANSRKLINDANIGGHDYLHNMIHLPFFLQNSGLRKVKIAQKSSFHKRSTAAFEGSSTELSVLPNPSRRSSNDVAPVTEKLKIPGKRSSRKLKLSDSIASSLGSNLNRAGGPQDLTKMLLTDDYFSDVNPRSMRRLMNVVYITGRLLKAFQIDFNWYHLASWINITEQWPYRTSWLIYHHDISEETFEDSMSLKALYDKVRNKIPTSKDVEPLVELDRDEKKLDVFLSFHRSTLLVNDLRVFLPFTINLDPYIKKVIKDGQQEAEEMLSFVAPPGQPVTSWDIWNTPKPSAGNVRKPQRIQRHDNVAQNPMPMYGPAMGSISAQPWASLPIGAAPWMTPSPPPPPKEEISLFQLPPEFSDVPLSSLNVNGICQLITSLTDLQESFIPNYIATVQQHNINGKVMLYCDLEELKKVLNMSFGDWEMFKMVIKNLRLKEQRLQETSGGASARRLSRSSEPKNSSSNQQQGHSSSSITVVDTRDKIVNKQQSSTMEKQITLEEQMICGALQTLNEEACEDVLEEKADAIVDPSGDLIHFQSMGRTLSQCSFYSTAPDETDSLILQNVPSSSFSVMPIDNQSSGSSGTNTPNVNHDAHYDSESQKSRPSSLHLNHESRASPPRISLPAGDYHQVHIGGIPDDQVDDDESTPLVNNTSSPGLASPTGPTAIIITTSSSESIGGRRSPVVSRQYSFDRDPETTV